MKKKALVSFMLLTFFITACGNQSALVSKTRGTEETKVETVVSKEVMLEEAQEFNFIEARYAFRENQMRAEETYANKIYKFTGCGEIEEDCMIMHEGGLKLRIELSHDDLLKLNTGEIVTIVGLLNDDIEVEEKNVGGYPVRNIVLDISPAYFVTNEVTLTGKIQGYDVLDNIYTVGSIFYAAEFYPDTLSREISLGNDRTGFIKGIESFQCDFGNEKEGIFVIDGQNVPNESIVTISAKINITTGEISDFKLVTQTSHTENEIAP